MLGSIFLKAHHTFLRRLDGLRAAVRTRCHLAESICATMRMPHAGRGRLTRRRRAELPSSCWPSAEPRAPRSTRIERLSTRSHKPVDAACESTARDKYNEQNHLLRDARRQLVISTMVRRAVRIPRPVTIVTSLRGAAQALLRLARRSKTSCTPAVSHACRNADDERARCESDRIAFRRAFDAPVAPNRYTGLWAKLSRPHGHGDERCWRRSLMQRRVHVYDRSEADSA